MSDIYNGIELNFTVDTKSINNVREQLRKGLAEQPVRISNITVTKGAVESIRKSVRDSLKDQPLTITNAGMSDAGVRSLKKSINEKLSKSALTLNGLKAGSLSLRDVKITDLDVLRRNISTAINNGAYSITITNVNAKQAISRVQEQLKAAMSEAGFSAGGTAGTIASNATNRGSTIKADDTAKQTQLGFLKQQKKELDSIKSSLRKNIAGQSDDVRAKVAQLEATLVSATKNIEKLGIQGDIAFNRIKTRILEDHAALQGMIAEANNLTLGGLVKVANGATNRISANGNAITDTKTLSILRNEWDVLQKKIQEATNAVVRFGEPMASQQILPDLEKEVMAYSRMVEYLRELNGLGIKPISTPDGFDVDSLKAQVAEAKEIQTSMNDLRKVWANATKADNYNKNIMSSDEFSAMEAHYQKLIGLHEQYKTVASPTDREKLAAAIRSENAALAAQVHEVQELVAANNRLNRTQNNQKIRDGQNASMKSVNNLAGQIQSYLNANSQIRNDPRTSGYHQQLSGYLNTLRSVAQGNATIVNKELDKISAGFKNAQREVKQFGVSGQTMFERFSKGFEKFGGWMMITSALMEGVTVIHTMIDNVFKLDEAMTQLRKVTDETEATYAEFYDVAVSRSKEIGATVSEMINATSDFARLGYNITDAEGLAEVANIYMHVGDNIASIDDASQSIISTLKAFYNTGEEGLSQVQAATHIVDSFNEVGNNFAISSDGIGEALKRSASALQAGNNSMEESIGLITGMNSVLQDPEKVGTVLKTVSMYIRSSKAELQDAGESTDGLVQSTAKLRELILGLTNQKVDIMQDPTTIKSTYQVFKELSEVWGEMTDVNRASLLEAIGGKRNANATAALLNNFKIAEEAMETANNSAGSAMRENEKQMESIEGKVRQLKSTFEAFSNDVLSSGMFKAVISGITATINGLNRLVNLFGALPTTLAVATAAWKAYGMAKAAAQRMSSGEAPSIRDRIKNIRDNTNTSSGGPVGTNGKRITINTQNADVQKLSKSLDVVREKFGAVRTAISWNINGTNKLIENINDASAAVQKYKTAANDAMKANDFAGVVSNTGNMNAEREKLRSAYKQLQTQNPALAAQMQGIFNGGMMGQGDQLQKTLLSWKSIKNAIAAARTQMAGLNVQEKAAKITADLMNISFATMKVSIGAVGKAFASAMGAFAIGLAIQAVVTAVDKFVNRYKNAAAEAANVAEETREISNENRETNTTVDGIIEKYKEYGKLQSDSATKNAENRATLIGLQSELNDAIGDQASKVDLVNGKYQNQIEKLEQIKKKLNETQQGSDSQTLSADIESSRANYMANRSKEFNTIRFDADDKSAKKAARILNNSKLSKYLGISGNTINPLIQGEGIESTIDQLEVINDMLELLQKNGIESDNTVFSALAADANKLNAALGDTFKDAKSALDTVVEGEILKSPFEAGSQSLIDYRDNLRQIVREEGNVKLALDNGLITQKGINQAIDEYIQSNYPDEYAKQIVPMKEVNAIAKELFTGKNGQSRERLKEQVQNAFKGDELEIAYSLILDKDKSFKGLSDLKNAVREEMEYMGSSDYVADQLRDTLSGILGDDANKTAVSSLKKLAATTGIKASDIEDFAAKSEELTAILDENGISAEYLAQVLQREFDFKQTGAGIASITGAALDLNNAMNGMEKALDRAALAKAKYDAAMSRGNSDTGFRDASEAFDKAFTAGRMGRTGQGSTDFWAGAEYLLGEDQLSAMNYDADQVLGKLKELQPILKNAETAGLGFVQQLKSMADESGNVVYNGEKIASITTDANGVTTIDARAENFKKIADMLGVSESLFTDSLNAAREWANVVTFSTEDVYNKLRDTGAVLDNTAGTFKKFSNAEIIDTKNLEMSEQDLRRFKEELQSTGGTYAFLDLQSGAEEAIKSLEAIGVAKEKLNKDGSGTGEFKIDTKSLNNLLAALGYEEQEVRAVYDELKEKGSLSDESISKAMDDYAKKADGGTKKTRELKSAIDSLKGKRIELQIEAKVNGAAMDPNDPYNKMPNLDEYKKFLENETINPPEFNPAMQGVIDDIAAGAQRAQDNISAMRGAIESSLDFDGGAYNNSYADYWRQQMNVAEQTMAALRAQGLTDTDKEMAEQQQKYNEGLKGLLNYDKQFYEQQKAIREDAAAQIQENPFGDAISNKDAIISAYRDIYEGAAAEREKALAAGYPANSEFVRSLEAEMRKAINSMEDARRNAFKSQLSMGDLQADILSRDRHSGESADGIVAMYSQAMNAISAEAARVRAEGATENNEYLMELTRQWYDYRDKIKEVQKQVYAEQTAWTKHLTTMQENSLVGSSGKSSMIGAYQNEQNALQQEIANLAALGYKETDQEIYSLREQIAALDNSIREVQKEVMANAAAFAKHQTTMAQHSAALSGDNRSMIGYYRNEQNALQQQIASLAAMGYQATDQEIYSLREQIADLDDAIREANVQWLNVQAQIDRREGSIMEYYHASPKEMMQYYDKMIQRTEDRRQQLYGLGYGEFSSEVQSNIDEYWDYMKQRQDAYKQSMQEAIDVYSFYKKQLEVGNYPFEEQVRVIKEEMELVQDMTEELRAMGYHENSSEVVSLKNQYLELIESIKSEATKAISEIDRQYDHQLKMIDNNFTVQGKFDRSVPLLKERQQAYHELAEQLRGMGFADDTEQIQSLKEKWWEAWNDIVNLYKERMDEVVDVSEHAISTVYDRHNYSYAEYEEEYRRVQADLHKTAEAYRQMGIDENDQLIRELQSQWWEYEDKISETYKKLVDDADAALQAIKGAYDDFFKAAEDYVQYGTLTYDTYKALVDLGPEYMSYLQDQNGLLQLNQKTIKQVIAAKAEQLAVDTALNYVHQIEVARQNEDYDTLSRLTKGLAENADATKDLVYARLALVNLPQDQYESALGNLNRYFSMTKQFIYDMDTALNPEKVSTLDDLSKSFDDFVKYVEDMIKAEHDDMKEALEEQLDLYEDITKQKKEALDLAKEEADYEESVAEQVKEIAKLQNQIDQLSLDDSRDASVKRTKLQDDLIKAQKKLADDQQKHSIDAAKEQLDADAEALKKETEERKKAIDEEVSSAEKVHRLAMDRIMQYGEQGLDKLLDEVLAWNLKAGNSLERNIKDTWADILQLVERYGSLVGAIEAIRSASMKDTVESVISSSGNGAAQQTQNVVDVGGGVVTVGRSLYGTTEGSQYKDALNEMIKNSVEWWLAKMSGDTMSTLTEAAANEALSSSFKEKTGITSYRDAGGRWWISGAKNQPLYENQDVGQYVVAQMKNNDAAAMASGNSSYAAEMQQKNADLAAALSHYTGATVENRNGTWYYNGHPLYDESLVFHKGGVVGKGSLKQDEVMAKLQEGEIVLNKGRQKGLFKLVDLASYLSDKLGVNLRKTNLSLSGGSIEKDLGIATTKPTNQINSNVNFTPSINVTISGGDNDPVSAKKYAKSIADLTLGNLKDAFMQRGITKSLANA